MQHYLAALDNSNLTIHASPISFLSFIIRGKETRFKKKITRPRSSSEFLTKDFIEVEETKLAWSYWTIRKLKYYENKAMALTYIAKFLNFSY